MAETTCHKCRKSLKGAVKFYRCSSCKAYFCPSCMDRSCLFCKGSLMEYSAQG
ncbi:MAG: hypothetical protein HY924_00805 [Elusimicrobia bacterium]|nr:hypothetical protein [Elusimicrobiota bacterium]